MSVYPLTLGDVYVGIPFTRGRHICRLTSKRVKGLIPLSDFYKIKLGEGFQGVPLVPNFTIVALEMLA